MPCPLLPTAVFGNEVRLWAPVLLTLGKATNVQTLRDTSGVSDVSTHHMAESAWVGAGSSTSGLSELNAIGVTVTATMSAASTGFSVVQTAAVLESVV